MRFHKNCTRRPKMHPVRLATIVVVALVLGWDLWKTVDELRQPPRSAQHTVEASAADQAPELSAAARAPSVPKSP